MATGGPPDQGRLLHEGGGARRIYEEEDLVDEFLLNQLSKYIMYHKLPCLARHLRIGQAEFSRIQGAHLQPMNQIFQVLLKWFHMRVLRVRDLVSEMVEWTRNRYLDPEVWNNFRSKISPAALPANIETLALQTTPGAYPYVHYAPAGYSGAPLLPPQVPRDPTVWQPLPRPVICHLPASPGKQGHHQPANMFIQGRLLYEGGGARRIYEEDDLVDEFLLNQLSQWILYNKLPALSRRLRISQAEFSRIQGATSDPGDQSFKVLYQWHNKRGRTTVRELVSEMVAWTRHRFLDPEVWNNFRSKISSAALPANIETLAIPAPHLQGNFERRAEFAEANTRAELDVDHWVWTVDIQPRLGHCVIINNLGSDSFDENRRLHEPLPQNMLRLVCRQNELQRQERQDELQRRADLARHAEIPFPVESELYDEIRRQLERRDELDELNGLSLLAFTLIAIIEVLLAKRKKQNYCPKGQKRSVPLAERTIQTAINSPLRILSPKIGKYTDGKRPQHERQYELVEPLQVETITRNLEWCYFGKPTYCPVLRYDGLNGAELESHLHQNEQPERDELTAAALESHLRQIEQRREREELDQLNGLFLLAFIMIAIFEVLLATCKKQNYKICPKGQRNITHRNDLKRLKFRLNETQVGVQSSWVKMLMV